MPGSIARAFLALVFVLTGPACRAKVSLAPPHAPELVVAEPLPVTLSGSLRGWKEKSPSFGTKTKFRLGPLLTRLFSAHDGRAFLSPVQASLESHWSGDARAWKSRYSFTLSLQLDGIHHEVFAVGYGQSDGNPLSAERTALENCVSDIHARVAAILDRRGES